MDVIKSKSFWSALATMFATVIVALIPELEPVREEIILGFSSLGIALISGHKIKDIALVFAKAWASRPTSITGITEDLQPMPDDNDSIDMTKHTVS